MFEFISVGEDQFPTAGVIIVLVDGFALVLAVGFDGLLCVVAQELSNNVPAKILVTIVKCTGFVGGSFHLIPTSSWSVCFAL